MAFDEFCATIQPFFHKLFLGKITMQRRAQKNSMMYIFVKSEGTTLKILA